jgi:hypothetical protein
VKRAADQLAYKKDSTDQQQLKNYIKEIFENLKISLCLRKPAERYLRL